jgi:hypothetical protein
MTNDCGAAPIDILMQLADNKCDRLIVILTGIFSRDGKIHGWQICDRLADCVQNRVSRL